MKNSRAIILSILIITVLSLSVGALSAQSLDDDSADVMVGVDNGTEGIGDIYSMAAGCDTSTADDNSSLAFSANSESIISDDGEGNVSDPDTFYQLYSLIGRAGNNLTLENDYNSTSYSSSGIAIYKDFTINGNGHYIDTQGLSRVFNINGRTLTLNNIRFIASQGTSGNSASFLNLEGGAIFAFNSTLIIENCIFDSFNSNFGGALCCLETKLILNNVSFINCSSQYYGGAIYQMYGNLSASSSYFSNCSAIDGAGIFADDLDSANIANTRFYENNASLLGGAIFSNEIDDLVIEDCTFVANTAAHDNKSYVDNGESHVLNYYGENLVDGSDYNGYDVYNQAKYDLYVFYDNDYELFYNNGTIVTEFPESYDLRTLGLVTDVKNQRGGGNCWSFSSIAALESAILKATNGTVYLDLSEENMKNLMAYFSPFGTIYMTNLGGNDRLSNAYLTAGLGPVLESLDNYVDIDYLSALFDPYTHVPNILWITRNNYTDNDGIKYALLNYGAVSVSCYFSSAYANGSSYYYDGTEGRNHAVTIVGWDDGYSASNFKTMPKGDGAWIVKNSWGDHSGDNGYYYVSYYDTRFAIGQKEAFCYVLNNSVKYRKTYQYDIVGMSDWLYNESATQGIWYKNIFNATDDEVLAAFSTYFNELTNYTAYVYVNDELVNEQRGSASNGYYTIKLSKYISLKKGDKFEIVLNVRSDKISIIPISESTASQRNYALEGVSFFSFDGENWEDLYSYSGEYYERGQRTHWYDPNMVACLKAFTVPKVNTTDIVGFKVFNETYGIGDTVNVPVLTPIDFIAMIVDEYGDLVNNGIFKVTINGDEYLIGESNNYTITFNNIGVYTITFIELDGLDAYYNFSRTIELGTLNVGISTSISFETVPLENYDTRLDVSIIDFYGNPVLDGFVSFEIFDSNGNSVLNHTDCTDFTFDYYLDPGVYSILFNFTSDNDDYLNSSLSGSFKVRNLTSISLSLKDILYGEKENITCILNISDVNLTYVINGSNGYYGVFNSSVSLILSGLDVGTYDVLVRFNGNDDYAHNSTTGSFVVSQRPSAISYSYAKIYAYPNYQYFIVTLKDSVTGNALANKSVQYIFNGKTIKTKTDANGVLKIKISVKKYGNYSMQVNFLGDNHYKASGISKTVKVYKNNVKFVSATKKVKKSNSKRKFKITLKTSNNKLLKSKYVYLTINKKTYKVKTSSKGKAVFKIKLPKIKKTYKYKVKFKGDNGNKAKTYKAKLKVY